MVVVGVIMVVKMNMAYMLLIFARLFPMKYPVMNNRNKF